MHDYLFLHTPKPGEETIPEPDLVVVDESVVMKAFRETSFTVDRIDGLAGAALRDCLDTGADIREALLDHGVTAEFGKKRAKEYDPSGNIGIFPDTDDPKAEKILDELASEERNKIASFYRQIAVEIDKPRPLHSIEVRRNDRFGSTNAVNVKV